MSQIQFEQTVQQWEQYGMTEDEWRTYEDEYADYLDNIRFTGNTLKDKVAVLNAREQAEHDAKRKEALNRVRDMMRAKKEQAELDH
jgi:uncharacterized protein YnzC (UPF0291/DUF896 family)